MPKRGASVFYKKKRLFSDGFVTLALEHGLSTPIADMIDVVLKVQKIYA
jgi:hypothetical protein